MLKLLERNIATIERRLVLIAPPQTTLPSALKTATVDARRHRQLVGEMQALRGDIYLDGGYVTRDQLSAKGLHQTPEDQKSWHLLMTDSAGRVTSCAWYLEHENTVSMRNLRVRNCPLVRSAEWRAKVHFAVESEIARARRDRLRYAEVGGWAVSKDRRCSSDGLMLALAGYGLCRLLGGALGITTANVSHASSSILQRLGGSYLDVNGTPIPAYFDPKYNTMIELLKFDSRQSSTKYAALIDLLESRMANVPVIAQSQPIRTAPLLLPRIQRDEFVRAA